MCARLWIIGGKLFRLHLYSCAAGLRSARIPRSFGYLCLQRERPTCILHEATTHSRMSLYYTSLLVGRAGLLFLVYHRMYFSNIDHSKLSVPCYDACRFCQSDLQAVARYGLDSALPILKKISQNLHKCFATIVTMSTDRCLLFFYLVIISTCQGKSLFYLTFV